MSFFIITYTPYFKKSSMRDIGSVDPNAKIEKLIADDKTLISSQLDEKIFLNKLQKKGVAFIKHICPANFIGKISSDLEKDKQTILNAILDAGISVHNKEKFAVQTRIVSGGSKDNPLSYKSKDLEVFIGSYFESKGGIPTFSDKKITNEDNVKIISVFIDGENAYIGESDCSQNLNFNCDDYRAGSRNGGREISRAENKLKEALAKYKLHLNGEGKIALDCGAAPGGWTKVLADCGYFVVAVDPGDLHPDLQKHPKIKHYKCRIEELIPKFEEHFDIIVNDMNVDPEITGQIMNSLTRCLKKDGLAIVTLKLPNNPQKGVNEGKEELSKNFNVLNINSLFHNRQEVTALIQKKKEEELKKNKKSEFCL